MNNSSVRRSRRWWRLSCLLGWMALRTSIHARTNEFANAIFGSWSSPGSWGPRTDLYPRAYSPDASNSYLVAYTNQAFVTSNLDIALNDPYQQNRLVFGNNLTTASTNTDSVFFDLTKLNTSVL